MHDQHEPPVKWELREDLRRPGNEAVARFLDAEQPSAHSDVATELVHAVRLLPGVGTWCPDRAAYAYVVAYSADARVFAVAYGGGAVALCVGPENLADALADGGRPAREIGSDWVRFEPFVASEPAGHTRARLRSWCEIAFHHMRGARR